MVGEAGREEVEPLPKKLWLARIERIAEGRFATLENALRHASHLLELAPLEFREFARPSISEEQFEALLTRGDLYAAARHWSRKRPRYTCRPKNTAPVSWRQFRARSMGA